MFIYIFVLLRLVKPKQRVYNRRLYRHIGKVNRRQVLQVAAPSFFLGLVAEARVQAHRGESAGHCYEQAVGGTIHRPLVRAGLILIYSHCCFGLCWSFAHNIYSHCCFGLRWSFAHNIFTLFTKRSPRADGANKQWEDDQAVFTQRFWPLQCPPKTKAAAAWHTCVRRGPHW